MSAPRRTQVARRARPARAAEAPERIHFIACPGRSADPRRVTPAELGAKAHNLLRMAGLGLAVPPAFVIPTDYCRRYESDPGATKDALRVTCPPALAELETATGRRFGDPHRPLLLSIRSGAPVSMPGMMETLLNIGLSDSTLAGLIRQTGNPRLAWDGYRRLIAGFGEVVAGIPAGAFEEELQRASSGHDERAFDFDQLRALARRYLEIYRDAAGTAFPQNPFEQLESAVAAVFASWRSAKAAEYRRLNRIAADIGTAVTAQAMVFGNSGGMSGAGVGFSRDPSTGAKELWVDFLFDAQGEDVVSGRRSAHGHASLEASLPAVWSELEHAVGRLEREFADMQDFEFTVQEGRLFLLQTRSGKRTQVAHARITLDLVEEGILKPAEAINRLRRIAPGSLGLTRIVSSEGETRVPAARAAAASSGVAWGEIAFDEARARARRAAGIAVILVRRDAETADIAALEAAAGLLTQRGARTSHAAVIARQLGKVCLVGCEELVLDDAARSLRIGDLHLAEGDLLTLDGNAGCVYAGRMQTIEEKQPQLASRIAALRRTKPARKPRGAASSSAPSRLT